MTSAAMEDDNHVAHVDETGYEEDDEGGVHMKRNKSKSNLSKFTTSKVPSRNLKRSALIRDSFALKEHRWKLHDPFVVDPTDSFTLDALEPTKCAIKAIEANFVEGTATRLALLFSAATRSLPSVTHAIYIYYIYGSPSRMALFGP